MQLVGVAAELVVDGEAGDGIGSFSGRVLAIALDDRTAHDTASGPSAAATWLLVADDRRPAPVWVPQTAVTAQRLGR